MKSNNNGFLATIDHYASHLGPVNSLVGWLVERLAPAAEAKAGCAPGGSVVCQPWCDSNDFGCWLSMLCTYHQYYAINFAECAAHHYAECTTCAPRSTCPGQACL
jgi:hypothetical protein